MKSKIPYQDYFNRRAIAKKGLANTSSIASIEYAVANIGSPIIVVLGHESCGAVGAAVKGGDNGYNLNHLLGQIYPALIASKKDADISEIVKKNAELSAKELVNRSVIISEAVENDKLTIVSAYYHLDTGIVDFFD